MTYFAFFPVKLFFGTQKFFLSFKIAYNTVLEPIKTVVYNMTTDYMTELCILYSVIVIFGICVIIIYHVLCTIQSTYFSIVRNKQFVIISLFYHFLIFINSLFH